MIIETWLLYSLAGEACAIPGNRHRPVRGAVTIRSMLGYLQSKVKNQWQNRRLGRKPFKAVK
jgi:hypothetical protein